MQPEYLSGLKARLSNYPNLHKLERYLRELEIEGPLLVILFGSLVRGEYTQFSDMDVLVIFDRLPDWKERFRIVYRHSDGSVQPFAYTWEEILHMLEAGNTFIFEAIEEGAPVWDKGGYWQRLTAHSREIGDRYKIERVKDGWRMGSPA